MWPLGGGEVVFHGVEGGHVAISVAFRGKNGFTPLIEAVEGTLTFLPEEAEKTIEVVIIEDQLPEEHEDFFVDLSNARCLEERGSHVKS